MIGCALGQGRGRAFGTGWISGVLAVAFGALGYGGVLCLLFPWVLTTPDARAWYPVALFRLLIHAFLVAAVGLGALSALLRRRKTLGLTGGGLGVAGLLAGGGEVVVGTAGPGPAWLALDWLLLDLLLLAAIFVPLERAFARLPEQPIFRPGWSTDLAYFAVSHLGVQVTVLLTMLPATVVFAWAAWPDLQAAVAAQPLALQVVEVVVVADLAQYAVHRAFHRVPLLWRFHRIHHSSIALDWLAGSRLHLVDVVVTRGLSFVPLYLLGFAPAALYTYLVFVSFHAVFIHANVRWRMRPIEWLLVTPRFHHWHHAAHAEATDCNFAVHVSLIDRWLGTAYLPDSRWPERYGMPDAVADGWMAQLVDPFRAG